MRILVTKDSATKIPRDVADLNEARAFARQGFHVELINEQGGVEPLPAEEAAPESLDTAGQQADASMLIEGGEVSAPAASAPAKKAAAKRR